MLRVAIVDDEAHARAAVRILLGTRPDVEVVAECRDGVDAIDYVLKPFDDTRFFAAFDRARRRIDERRTARWARRLLAATPERGGSAPAQLLPRLPVPVGNRILFVSFDDIEWIQAADQY